MAVGITQLVGDRVQKEVTAFGVEVGGQMLENVHVRTVRNRRHTRRLAFLAYEVDGLGADVQDGGVQQRNIISNARLLRRL